MNSLFQLLVRFLITGFEFDAVARERIEDAKALLGNGRFAGAVYMCGYAVECALKASICRHQQWQEYRLDLDYRLMKTHSFEFLLSFSGREKELLTNVASEWWIMKDWNPNWRYLTIPTAKADDTIKAAEAIMEVLL